MADEVKQEAPVVKTEFQLEEERRAAQTQFDPKMHGVGTHPALGPKSVTELHKMHLDLAAAYEALAARVAALEG
jgi:hypothetical protein